MTSLRGTPLTYSDIFSIKDGLSIANKYITLPMIRIAVTILVLAIGITIYLLKIEKHKTRNIHITNLIILTGVIIIFSVNLVSLREKKILDVLRWDLKESYYHNGFVYSILDSGFGYIRKKPEEYNKANIEKIKEAKFSQDPIPNFRKLSQESLSGNINVPVTGGGTIGL